MTSLALSSRADRRLLLWCTVVAVALLVPLSIVPGLESAGSSGLDKPVHFLLFMVLAALAVAPAAARTHRPLVAAVVGGVLYGVVLEAVQGLTGVRNAELLDLVADGLGCCAGVVPSALRRRR